MEKLIKTAKRLDVIFRILFWFFIVCTVVMIIGISKDMLTEANQARGELKIIHDGITLTSQSFTKADYIKVLLFTIIEFIITSSIICYCISVFRHILQPMKEGKPFANTISLDFKKLGWVSLVYGIIYIVFDFIGKDIYVRIFAASEALGTIQHNVNLTFIIVALVLFLLSYIFRYGEELQRLSDETL